MWQTTHTWGLLSQRLSYLFSIKYIFFFCSDAVQRSLLHSTLRKSSRTIFFYLFFLFYFISSRSILFHAVLLLYLLLFLCIRNDGTEKIFLFLPLLLISIAFLGITSTTRIISTDLFTSCNLCCLLLQIKH